MSNSIFDFIDGAFTKAEQNYSDGGVETTNNIERATEIITGNIAGNLIADVLEGIAGGSAQMSAQTSTNVNFQGGASTDGIPTKARNVVPTAISECALYLNVQTGCMTDDTLTQIKKHEGIVENNKNKVVEQLKQKMGCDSERCIVMKAGNIIGKAAVDTEIRTRFKNEGPTDTKLLNNFNIDDTLKQWEIKFPDFFAYNFNMLDWASHSFHNGSIYDTPDSLATVNVADEYLTNSKRTFGCIINSDVYEGRGKHWMALFADARGDPSSSSTKWTVEFFNSSGNPPAVEWVNWLVKTTNRFEEIAEALKKSGKKVLMAKPEFIKATTRRHQQSKTECGVYSLFYIWARLNNVPWTFFRDSIIPDKLMFEFRHHLFYDNKRPAIKQFDWNKYKTEVKILWEDGSTAHY